NSCYVIVEELSEALAGDSFRRLLHSIGIGEWTALLGVILVHPLEQITQRFRTLRHLPHAQVQQYPDDFALVVVADAAFGRAVKCVAFEPGVEARLLRRLPAVRRTRLQFVDLAGDP